MRLLWAALLAASGCASGTPLTRLPIQPGSQLASIEDQDRERTVVVHVPPGGAARRPLVVALHGGGSSGESMEETTGLSRLADRHRFVAVYPDGIGGPHGFGRAWNSGDCCGMPHFFGIDDSAFVGALIDALVKRLRVDEQRIFVIGYSNGGLLALRVASEMGDRLAGVAIYAATLPATGPVFAPKPDFAPPRRPLSAIVIHSVADPRVSYQGREYLDRTNASSQHTAEFFAAAARCPRQPQRRYAAARGAQIDAFERCADGTEVEWITLYGWDHEWPARSGIRDCRGPGEPLYDFDAAEHIWRFFSDKRSSGR